MNERRAYICTNKECVPPFRLFLLLGEPDSVARCKDHGARWMVRQTNVTYHKGEK